MAATYAITIAAVPKQLQPGWSHEATANGRDTLSGEVISADGSYRPALGAVVAVAEGVDVWDSYAGSGNVSTVEPHGLVLGMTVQIVGHTGSTPALDGVYAVTAIVSPTIFTINVAITVGGHGGLAYRRIFGGTITKPSERGLDGLGHPAITTRIATDDYNVKAERRVVNEVLAAGTLKSMLTTLATNYGLTLHSAQVDGPSLAELPCEYAWLKDVLDQLSLLTTASGSSYVWEFDEYDKLRMYLPNTELAPFNIVDGDGHAIGDITVEPTRTNYANHVILRFSAEARPAYAFLVKSVASGNFADGETVKLGPTTYTFQTTLTDTAGNVHIGGSVEQSFNNLIYAINRNGGTPNVDYAASTTENSSAIAYRLTYYNTTAFPSYAFMMKAVARTPGAAGNATATEETSGAKWVGEGNIPTGTMILGADQLLTNVAFAEDLGEQALYDIWDTVVEAPETTNAAAAAILAAAVLAVRLVVPRTVRYDTLSLGLRPGQVQTINVARRSVNNTFLIMDISTKHIEGNLVLRSVTAIENLLLQGADRWRDTYKLWSSGGSSSRAALVSGGSGDLTTINVTGAIYGFGGSDTDWRQTTAGGWVDANSIEIEIDTVARGSTVGTFYVRIRAVAGSVTARLRNVSDGITAGTSVAVTDTAFTATYAFVVALTPGRKKYRVQLSPSLADTDIQLGSGFLE